MIRMHSPSKHVIVLDGYGTLYQAPTGGRVPKRRIPQHFWVLSAPKHMVFHFLFSQWRRKILEYVLVKPHVLYEVPPLGGRRWQSR